MTDPLKPHTSRNRIRLGVIVTTVFVVGVIVGASITANAGKATTIESALRKVTGIKSKTDLDVLAQAWNLINSKYVKRPVDISTLVKGATAGLVQSLGDPYSYYLDPTDAQTFDNELNGKFDGIGAELGQKDGKTVIIAPLSGTPAEKAGLRAGDVIQEIDGTSTNGMTLDVAVQHIRGPEGTSVTLTIVRGTDPAKKISVTRSQIQLKSVTLSYKTIKSATIAVITITSFAQTTGNEFAQAVHDITLRQPKGIVVDLRNNSGGYLDAAVSVADAFIESGPVVTEDFGNGKKDVTSADGTATLSHYHVAILMNGGTASAAEILAGALEDRVAAVTIGEKSFGKGSVQELETLDDGSTLKMTVAHWLTANGRSIDGTGLTPQIPIPLTEADATAQKDPQMQSALDNISAR